MRKFKTILCSLLSLCIIACPLASSITVSGAEDIDTLENKLDKLTKQSQEYQKTLDDTKNDISEKEAYSEALVGKIDVLSQKINATNQSINKLNTGIAQKKEQIDKGNKDIDSQVDALIDRLKAIDKAGSASDLEIVLGAKDLSDFIDKVNLVKTVSNIDKELINNINDKLTVVNKQKQELEKDKTELDKEKDSLQEDLDDLNGTLEKNKELLQDLYTKNENAKSKLDDVSGKIADQEKEIKAYWEADAKKRAAASAGGHVDVTDRVTHYEKRQQQQQQSSSSSSSSSTKKSSSSSQSSQQTQQSQQISESYDEPQADTPTTGGFVWPCPGIYYLTAEFGEDRTTYAHGAIDIGCPMNSTVVAAESGTVSYTCTSCTHNWGKAGSCGCGWGFGNFVWMDHGNGKETIYGHLTTVLVSPGQYVTKGTVIGYSGSTGHSSGPHLHFECRYNGVKYDPMSEY